MTVRYHPHEGQLYPGYVCQQELIDHAAAPCQHLPGQAIDSAVAQLLLSRITPLNLEVALAVQQEIVARRSRRLAAKQVARAQYEADLAGQRYRHVDPNNRLVAATLEAEWNAALRGFQEAQRDERRAPGGSFAD